MKDIVREKNGMEIESKDLKFLLEISDSNCSLIGIDAVANDISFFKSPCTLLNVKGYKNRTESIKLNSRSVWGKPD